MPIRQPNIQQQQAIDSTAATISVIAGPGTGKTFTLTERICSLINQKRVSPKQILAITFTRKARNEMETRLRAKSSDSTPLPYVMTLHEFCFKVLTFVESETPKIISEKERTQLIKKIATDFPKTSKKEILNKIQKNRLRSSLGKPVSNADLHLSDTYENYLKLVGAVDFDGLIYTVLQLLQSSPERIPSRFREFRHVLVDEFQDLDEAQQKLVLLLAQNASLFTIGDPNQAIYGFRGANSLGFKLIQETREDVETINLIENFRSAAEIVAVANEMIHSLDTEHIPLESISDVKGIVQGVVTDNENHEARLIVEHIQQLLGGITRQNFDTNLVLSHSISNLNFSDIAILVRNNFQLKPFKKYLFRCGIPFQIISKNRFLEEKTVTTILEQLPTALNSDTKTVKDVILAAAAGLGIDANNETVSLLIAESEGIEVNNLELAIQQFIQMIKLHSYDEQAVFQPDKVRLMTVHASKGLEFPAVFVAGCNDSLFPYSPGADPNFDASTDEEHRLLYVAITRAEQELYLYRTNYRTQYGQTKTQKLSRFLEPIPDTLLPTKVIVRKKTSHRQQRLF